MPSIKVRNKNVLLELLSSEQNFEKISIVRNLKKDSQTLAIIRSAQKLGVPINEVALQEMELGRSGNHREVIIGYLIPKEDQTLGSLLTILYQANQNPFFLLLNKVSYSNNLGVIIRTAFAAGVNGLIYQGDKNQLLSEEIFHTSMGTIVRIPKVKMTTFEALRDLKKEGITTYSLQTNGSPIFQESITGPAAFVLGEEGEGLSDNISNRCDKKLSIPMQPGIDSLNVSASAAIALYEKVRQEALRNKMVPGEGLEPS